MLRVVGAALERLDDVRRRRQVGIADAHVDEVGAPRPRLPLLLVDLGEEVGRQPLQALRQLGDP